VSDKQQPLAVLSPERVRVRCGACDVWFDSVFDLQCHSQSAAHQELATQILAANDAIDAALVSVLNDLRARQRLDASIVGRLLDVINQLREERHVSIAPNPSGQ